MVYYFLGSTIVDPLKGGPGQMSPMLFFLTRPCWKPYNSKTVGSSYMKFGQQFEINELYVCTKFRGNRLRDVGFRIRKPPRKFGVKSGLSQKLLKYGKHRVVCLKIPFYPNQPTFGRDKVYFFFFLFFLPNFCTLFFS